VGLSTSQRVKRADPGLGRDMAVDRAFRIGVDFERQPSVAAACGRAGFPHPIEFAHHPASVRTNMLRIGAGLRNSPTAAVSWTTTPGLVREQSCRKRFQLPLSRDACESQGFRPRGARAFSAIDLPLRQREGCCALSTAVCVAQPEVNAGRLIRCYLRGPPYAARCCVSACRLLLSKHTATALRWRPVRGLAGSGPSCTKNAHLYSLMLACADT